MSTIEENHRRKHDHSDSVENCRYCGGFLPKDFKRTVCKACGKPVRQYQPTE